MLVQFLKNKFEKLKHKIEKLVKTFIGEIERFFDLPRKHVHTPKQAIEQWLKKLDSSPPINGRVLITAVRNHTWIEWAVYCAAVIRQMGFETTLLYKNSEVVRFYKKLTYFNFWKSVPKIPGIEIIDIESLGYNQENYNNYYSIGHESAIAALAYDFHVESADIIDNPDIYEDALLKLKDEAAKNGARVFELCSKKKFHQFICYSGIIRDTKMILRGALDANQDSVAVEGWGWRPGHMIYNFNGPALEYNIDGWLKYFGTWDEKKEFEINKYFGFLDGFQQDEEWLKNFYMIQRSKVNEILPNYVSEFLRGDQKVFLLPCNVIGDSSLLNRESIFRSQRNFVSETVDYFKNNPNLKLIIRAHPGEVWVKSKVVIKMGEFAKDISKDITNILVIDSTDDLNTFSLVPYVHAALIWITSAGVDLVARGIPVIAAAIPKYTGLGIVEEPKSKEEFFLSLRECALKIKRPTEAQVQKAKEYLYLVFKGFSFEAQGRTFRANSCILDGMPAQEEHDRFYKILLKLMPAPDRTYLNN